MSLGMRHCRRWVLFAARLFTAIAIACTIITAQAMVVAGAGMTVIVPIVAQTGSFASEILVHAPSGAAATFAVTFHEAVNSATPGSKSCAAVDVPAGRVASLALGTQCNLGAGSHFGMLEINDAATPKSQWAQVYSRTSNLQGQGFSVEGFPIGIFSGASGTVAGLRRIAAAPAFQSNCFIAALSEPILYEITLRSNPGGATLGTPITGALNPWQMRRFLDVFGAQGANAAAGNYVNVTAEFRQTGPGNPAYVGLCTVQDSTSFGADFRIAKNIYANDQTRYRSLAYGHSGNGTLTDPARILAAGEKNVHVLNVRPPDRVQCDIVGPQTGVLEVRATDSDGVVLGGGSNAISAAFATGYRGDYGGSAPMIKLEVAVREGSTPAYPVDYGLTCSSGNGIGWPWWWRRASDDF